MVHVPCFPISPWTSVPSIWPWTGGSANGRREGELEHGGMKGPGPFSPWTSGATDGRRKDEFRALCPSSSLPFFKAKTKYGDDKVIGET